MSLTPGTPTLIDNGNLSVSESIIPVSSNQEWIDVSFTNITGINGGALAGNIFAPWRLALNESILLTGPALLNGMSIWWTVNGVAVSNIQPISGFGDVGPNPINSGAGGSLWCQSLRATLWSDNDFGRICLFILLRVDLDGGKHSDHGKRLPHSRRGFPHLCRRPRTQHSDALARRRRCSQCFGLGLATAEASGVTPARGGKDCHAGFGSVTPAHTLPGLVRNELAGDV